MKKYLKTFPELCIACHTCESVCSNLYFKQEGKSCIVITENTDGIEINACNQCQACVKVCPTQALSVTPQGVVMVNKSLCIHCYMCVAACPTQSFFRHAENLPPFKCIACGACTKSCPTGAIKIVQDKE
ncbi:MAG: aldehyde:ferredoxin oxidoreductase [Candidatus Cloacimonetes bacterium HGW-Cloacimonetes-1]|nr:MAG: aldehyde:ferredoxin oxidoreductase [Candidatus Cloacimonetes bacterium HGW-Cloacimonetes-1]